jgi:hypothetical protein
VNGTKYRFAGWDAFTKAKAAVINLKISTPLTAEEIEKFKASRS